MQFKLNSLAILLFSSFICFCQCSQNPCQIGANDARPYIGDFNGDGRSDIYCIDGPGNVYVLLSNDTNFGTPSINLFGFTTSNWCPSPNAFEVKDFDGDGKSDILCKTPNSHLILLSNGNKFVNPSGYTFPTTFCTGQSSTLYWEDFNGDGTLDLFCMNKDNSWLSVLVSSSTLALSSPNTNANGNLIQLWCHVKDGILFFGDFNNDKKTDVLCQSGGVNINVMISDGKNLISPNSFNDGSNGWFTRKETYSVYFKDLNGDGNADLIGHDTETGNIDVAFSTGTSFISTTTIIKSWCKIVDGKYRLQIVDFNNDKSQDLVCTNSENGQNGYFTYGKNGAVNPIGGLYNSYIAFCDQYLYGDFNGDSIKDMICYTRAGSPHLSVYLLKSSTALNLIINLDQGDTQLVNPCQVGAGDAIPYIGDFNGDGHSDIYCKDGPGNVYVLLSNDNYFGTPSIDVSGLTTSNWCPSPNAFEVKDFDGDGKSDILCKTPNSHLILLSNGNKFVNPSGYTFPTTFCTGQSSTLYWEDFNGDGTLDLFCMNKDNSWLSVLVSSSTLALSSPNTNANGNLIQLWCHVKDGILFFGDFNNDKKTDVLCQSGGVNINVMISDGKNLISPNSFNDGSNGWFTRKETYSVYFKDLNGDGNADLIGHDTETGNIDVAFSTGTSFIYTTTIIKSWCKIVDGKYRLQIVDFNNDKSQDLVCTNSENGQNGYFTYGKNGAVNPIGGLYNSYTAYCDQYLYGDFNGDSIKDMICYARAGSPHLSVYLLKPTTALNSIINLDNIKN